MKKKKFVEELYHHFFPILQETVEKNLENNAYVNDVIHDIFIEVIETTQHIYYDMTINESTLEFLLDLADKYCIHYNRISHKSISTDPYLLETQKNHVLNDQLFELEHIKLDIIDNLNKNYLDALILYKLHHYTTDEIVHFMNLKNRKQFHNLLSRAKAQLKTIKGTLFILFFIFITTFLLTQTTQAIRILMQSKITFIPEGNRKEINYDFSNKTISHLIPMVPTNIPDGYYLVEIHQSNSMYMIRFKKSHNKEIIYRQTSVASSISIDINAKTKKVVKDNMEYIYVTFANAKGPNAIFWADENYSYCIYANLKLHKIMDIIDSIEPRNLKQ